MTAKELDIIDNNEYQQWFQHLCAEIDKQRLKAAMQLNAATLQHYWWLGNDIICKQKEQGWGAKVIDQLSIDLQKRYGGDSGYSSRNLGYMKSFASEYPDSHFCKCRLQNYGKRQSCKRDLQISQFRQMEGNETVTNCHQLKLRAADGKMRLTDVADTEQLFPSYQLESKLGYTVISDAKASDNLLPEKKQTENDE